MLLRQWREEDAEPLAEVYSQPEYLEHMRAYDIDQTRSRILGFDVQWRREGFSHWAVEDPATKRLIGHIGLMRHHDWPESASPVEVGWALHRGWWGRGLATEGGRAAMRCWLEHLPDDELISITAPDNRRSRAVMERLGLSFRGETHWHGSVVVWYAVGREEARATLR